MGSYDDYRRRIIGAQDQWNRERDRIYGETRTYDTEFGGEYEPPSIAKPDVFDGMSLEDMQAVVSAMKPATIAAASTAWQNIGYNLDIAVSAFNREFARTITGDNGHGGWTGQSGQAAIDAVNDYAKQSRELASGAHVVGLKLAEMHTGLEQTQALFPGISVRPDLKNKTLPPDGVMKDGDYSREEATQEGRRILRTVYGQVAVQTDIGVPVLPAATQIVAPAGEIAPAPGGGDPGPSAGPDVPAPDDGNDSADADSTTPSHVNGNAAGDGSTDSNVAAKPGGNSQENPETGPERSQGTDPAATTPAAAEPVGTATASTVPGVGVASTTPAGLTPAAGHGGGTGPGGSFGRGGDGLGGGAGAGPVDAGRGVIRPDAAFPGVAPATATPAQTRNGMSGMGMLGPRKKNDDREKAGTPDYLVTKEHGEELTGAESVLTSLPPQLDADHDLDDDSDVDGDPGLAQ
ncbi:hypothetical protein NONO_c22280 [Nocardia nova SH22a]|uniref:PPE family protein n=2 Tax=Nocardia nova TaxID=37330 RepID=W5TIH1_9NOCA|nr:hypothetical protein NONO_c22280 [Nocardia nova SH22a]